MQHRPLITNLPLRIAGGALIGVAAATAMFGLGAVAARAAPPDASPQAVYQQDRAKCLSGKSAEDQATCLKEAGAARDEAMKGHLNDGDAHYRKNAAERCDALTGDDAKDCRARMKGAGTVSGSVSSGGIIRESTRVVPAKAASAP